MDTGQETAKQTYANVLQIDVVSTTTTYYVRMGDKHYTIERDHKPTRPENEFRVYGHRNGSRCWLDELGATYRKVLNKIKARLAAGPIENT